MDSQLKYYCIGSQWSPGKSNEKSVVVYWNVIIDLIFSELDFGQVYRLEFDWSRSSVLVVKCFVSVLRAN
jgi:hypothetical protein